MVKVGTFFAMSLGAFVFWETMDKVHVWIALRQDEKDQDVLRDWDVAKDLGVNISIVLYFKERLEREAEIRRMRQELLQQAKETNSLA